MGILLLLFIALPAVELALLIEIGRRIGTVETIGLIILTGVIGASLARHQGFQVLRQIESETSQGRLPGEALIDGMIILMAAALLVTPGVLTDAVGFLCLIPITRRIAKKIVWRWIQRRVERGQVHMTVHFGDMGGTPPGRRPAAGPVYDVTPEEEKPPRERLGDK